MTPLECILFDKYNLLMIMRYVILVRFDTQCEYEQINYDVKIGYK